MVDYRVLHASIKGRNKRDDRNVNEDTKVVDRYRNIYLVADGLGGDKHKEGKKFSSMVAQQLQYDLTELYVSLRTGQIKPAEIEGILRIIIQEANKQAHSWATQVEFLNRGGTTLDACFIHDGKAYLGHVGDGSIYLYNRKSDRTSQLTEEHTDLPREFAGFEYEQKKLVLSKRPLRNYLGKEQEVKIDTRSKPFTDDDVLLLASDGLTSRVTEAELGEILKKGPSRETRAELLDRARRPRRMREVTRQIEGLGFDCDVKKLDDTTFIAVYGGGFPDI